MFLKFFFWVSKVILSFLSMARFIGKWVIQVRALMAKNWWEVTVSCTGSYTSTMYILYHYFVTTGYMTAEDSDVSAYASATEGDELFIYMLISVSLLYMYNVQWSPLLRRIISQGNHWQVVTYSRSNYQHVTFWRKSHTDSDI